jgi:hypothetical protein
LGEARHAVWSPSRSTRHTPATLGHYLLARLKFSSLLPLHPPLAQGIAFEATNQRSPASRLALSSAHRFGRKSPDTPGLPGLGPRKRAAIEAFFAAYLFIFLLSRHPAGRKPAGPPRLAVCTLALMSSNPLSFCWPSWWNLEPCPAKGDEDMSPRSGESQLGCAEMRELALGGRR